MIKNIRTEKKTKTEFYQYIPDDNSRYFSGIIFLKLLNHNEAFEKLNHYTSLIMEKDHAINSFEVQQCATRITSACIKKKSKPKEDVSRFIERNMEKVCYLRSKFETIDNKGKGNCVFCSLVTAMGLEEQSYQELKVIISKYLKSQGQEKDASEALEEGKPAGQEVVKAFAMLMDCKVVIFSFEQDSTEYYSREIYSSDNDAFTIFLVRSWIGVFQHCKAALPKQDELYGNHFMFKLGSENLKKMCLEVLKNPKRIEAKIIDISAEAIPKEEPKQEKHKEIKKIATEITSVEEDKDQMEGKKKVTRKPPNRANKKEAIDFMKGRKVLKDCWSVKGFYAICRGKDTDRLESLHALKEDLINYKDIDDQKLATKLFAVQRKQAADVASEKFLRNILIEENIIAKKLNKSYHITNESGKGLGPSICGGCSGFNSEGKPVLRVINSAFALREHCSEHKVDGENTIHCGSALAVDIPENWTIFGVSHGANLSWRLMRIEDIPQKTQWRAGGNPNEDLLHIEGWNMRKSGNLANASMINYHLETVITL